jgi:hypothetical protein
MGLVRLVMKATLTVSCSADVDRLLMSSCLVRTSLFSERSRMLKGKDKACRLNKTTEGH